MQPGVIREYRVLWSSGYDISIYHRRRSANRPGSLLQGGGATKVLRLQLCLASALCDQCALPSSAPFVGGLRFLVETSATALRGTIHEYECVQVSFAFFASISSMLLISNAVIAQRVVAV